MSLGSACRFWPAHIGSGAFQRQRWAGGELRYCQQAQICDSRGLPLRRGRAWPARAARSGYGDQPQLESPDALETHWRLDAPCASSGVHC